MKGTFFTKKMETPIRGHKLSRKDLTTVQLQSIIDSASDNQGILGEYLDVGFNWLTTIPDLSRFTNLVLLRCSYNRLTHINTLSSLPFLRFLYCEGNQITSLDEVAQLTYLKDLVCHGNQLQWLPDCSLLMNLDTISTTENVALPDDLQIAHYYFSFNYTHAPLTKVTQWREATRVHHRIRTQVRPAVVALLGVIRRRRAIRDILGLVARMMWRTRASHL